MRLSVPRLAYRLACAIVPLLLASLEAKAAELKYGIGSWPAEGLGNVRALVSIDQKADAVAVHIPWRRRDDKPENKQIIVIDAATNQRVNQVLRVQVNREFGDLLLQPPTVPGQYYVYYMPYRTEGSWWFPTTTYLPVEDTAEARWAADCQPLVRQWKEGGGQLPMAKVLEIQVVNDFHRFDPMEIVATASEKKQLLATHSGRPYLLFPEDRKYPIRMTDDLPLRWIERGPGQAFQGEACRGEFFAFQIGLFACGKGVEDVTVDFGELRSPEGQVLSKSALRCFNLGGIDWLGRPFRKTVNVPQGRVQPLWFGVDVPKDAAPATYRGTFLVQAKGEPATEFTLTLSVSDTVLEDGGDGELARQSRLRWLDSTIGLDDEAFPPYVAMVCKDREVSVLGRSATVAPSGLLSSITSRFSRNVDAADEPPQELLAEPMRFVVEPRPGNPLVFSHDEPKIVSQASGAVAWEASSAAGPLKLICRAKMECDGYVNYKLGLTATEAMDLSDLRLEIPLRREIATYMMGMGRKGGYRPAQWQWTWDPARSNNQLWIGDVNAGLSCKLKHTEDRWDLYNLRESGIYQDWGNAGKGGCTVSEVGDRQVLIRAYTGPRRIAAGESLKFNFGLLITPVKTLDKAHWQWRYFHRGNSAPVDEVASTGATVINLHQGDTLNPYINYPFLTTDRLSAYATAAHAKQMKVKIYYTIRELSNYTAEFWGLRSLGNEIFTDGPGFRLADQFTEKKEGAAKPNTGGSWLCEHAIHGYVPAWHTPLGNGQSDAAIATTGLSRWHNYYLEGLNWLIRHVGVDGLYLDGIGYDREIMKRVRKVMQRGRPGCLIDFHSGNNFHPEYGLNNCANQYLELFPCVDSLWFGEGYDYNETPDYWLVEMSGIPYGLFSEMLQGGGNPWRGMLYGMSNRLGWGGDPRPLWKLWDAFGIQDAKMSGYWDPACPVKTGRQDVLATTYVRPGKTLIALASWAPTPTAVRLSVDFQALGLDPDKTSLFAPPVSGFQTPVVFRPGDAIPLLPGRGWLLIADEQPHRLPPAVDLSAGRKTLLDDRFSAKELSKDWQTVLSKRPGTALHAADGEMRIEGAANVAAFAERALPKGAALVLCSINQQSDGGASWGPGMALVWSDKKVLRVNLRIEGRLGVDDGQRQILEGIVLPETWTQVAICLEEKEVLVQASQNGAAWQEIARFARSEFPGDPVAVRLGKMSPGSKNEDFSELGPQGVCAIKDFRVLGKQATE